MYLKYCPKHKITYDIKLTMDQQRRPFKIRVCNVCVLMAKMKVRELIQGNPLNTLRPRR